MSESQLSPSALRDKLKTYLLKHHYEEVGSLFPFSTFTLTLADDELENLLLEHAEFFREELKEAIIHILTEIKKSSHVRDEYRNLRVKLATKDDYVKRLSDVPPDMINSPISFNAVVIAAGEIQSYIQEAYMFCPKCDYHGFYPGTINGIATHKCMEHGETDFPILITAPTKSRYSFFQELVLQEPLEETKGHAPVEYGAIIKDDQVGDVHNGQKKLVLGIFKAVRSAKKQNQFEHLIEVISMNDTEIQEYLPNDKELEYFKSQSKTPDYFKELSESIAPHIIQMDDIKKNILLQLIGGVDFPKIRSYSNTFLIGDPSMAKTELLLAAKELEPKSMYSVGSGGSKAGLTIGVVKRPNGTYVAQAGVLPLCDEGLACLDELDKMEDNDRNGLHEAMENGQCTNTKIIITTLKARTKVLAAANPKRGRYDENKSVRDQFDIPPPLLTRFDNIWLVVDEVSNTNDHMKADHILSYYRDGEKKSKEGKYSYDELRKLVGYTKKLKPKLSREADQKLLEFYKKIRLKSKEQESIAIVPRHLHGLVRLAFAHAKLHFKSKVDVQDAEIACDILTKSLESLKMNIQHVEQDTFWSSDKINKMDSVEKILEDIIDENNSINLTEFISNLAETKYFNEYSATIFAEKFVDEKFRLLADGRYTPI